MKKNRFLKSLFCRGVLTITVIAMSIGLFSPNIIYAKSSALLEKKLIKGTVTDQKTSNSLPGLTIVVKGTSVGTVTDIDGKYSIMASEKDVLEFSFIGYTKKEVLVGNQTTINVSLSEDVMGLDEVVVTGYGVQKKSDLTGAVSSVSGENLTKMPIANIDQALQGQAAGVNITSKSGRPGESVDIKIRGISSINGTQPLIIIDGASGSLSNLNPNDIASIEVLKDASSAAIYGATGGNGVILVTTKKGSAGKIRTNVNLYRGVESISKKIDLMNSQEWIAVCEEIDYRRPTATNSRPDTLKTYDWQDIVFKPSLSENYDISTSGGNEVSNFLISSSYSKQNGIVQNTDYQRITFRINSEHKLSKRITFDEKISFTNSVNSGLEDWVWHDYYNNPMPKALSMDPNLTAYDANGVWTVPLSGGENPLIKLDMNTDRKVKNNRFNGNFGLKINILKGLDFTSRFNGDLGFEDMKYFQDKYWATTIFNNPNSKLSGSMKRNLSYNAQNLLNYQTTIAGNHNISVMVGMEATKWWWYDISGSRVDMQSSDPWMLYFDKSTNNESSLQFVKGTGGIGSSLAYFGRINYNFKDKYLLTLNMRRDGSSSFGPAYRWGNFPSFSFGWKFTEESFMKDIKAISFGKLRFGYGQTGANARSGFPFLSSVVSTVSGGSLNTTYGYSLDGLITSTGTGPAQIPNPEVRWESINMSNLGLDMSFFDNRLSLSADLFNKVNDGMLMQTDVSYTAGTYYGLPPEQNIGSISNKGYEVTITARKKDGELKGSIDLNFSGVKNEVLELAGVDHLADVGKVHIIQPTNRTAVGMPIAQFWGYERDLSIGNGLFRETDPTEIKGSLTIITNQPFTTDATGNKTYAKKNAKPGDVRYKDVTLDGKINTDDKVYLGSPLPKLTYGFSINLEYKGFDLSAFFNGTLGNKILNGTKQYLYYSQGYGNRAKAFADRYVQNDIIKKDDNGNDIVVVHQNLDTDIPRFAAENFNQLTDFFIEDGSYLMLKNLVVGYTIPQKVSNVINLEKVRIYGGAKNLFTLTKYTGFSPEVAGITAANGNAILESGVDYGVYPTTRMFYFGINVAF